MLVDFIFFSKDEEKKQKILVYFFPFLEFFLADDFKPGWFTSRLKFIKNKQSQLPKLSCSWLVFLLGTIRLGKSFSTAQRPFFRGSRRDPTSIWPTTRLRSLSLNGSCSQMWLTVFNRGVAEVKNAAQKVFKRRAVCHPSEQAPCF